MTRKPTKRDRLYDIREYLNASGAPEYMVEFVDGEIDRLARKSATRKPTKTQLENVQLKRDIVVTIEGPDGNGVPLRAGTVGKLNGISTQKATALLSQLVADGSLIRVTDEKGVVYFDRA